MLIRITVINEQGHPLPATLRINGGQGYGLYQSDIGLNGVTIDSENMPGVLSPDTMWTVSSPGYQSLIVSGNAIQQESEFTLVKSNATILLVSGMAAGVLLFSLEKQGRRVKGFSDMAPMAQTGIVIGGLGVLAYLLLKGNTGNDTVSNAARNEYEAELAKGNYPTISETEAEQYSAELRTAFDDCGTDDGVVNDVMERMQNRQDLLLLVATYGTRSYKGCFDGDYFSEHSYSLPQAMRSEHSTGRIREINDMFASRGINYQF